MDTKPTLRGFARGEFLDFNGVSCSIQKSSIATDDCIWLGANDIGLKRFEPGRGWTDIELEENDPDGISHFANTRMHLSRDQVLELLPLLQHFADTGDLPETSNQ